MLFVYHYFLESSKSGDVRAPFYLKYLSEQYKFILDDLTPEDQHFLEECVKYLPLLPAKTGQGPDSLQASIDYISFSNDASEKEQIGFISKWMSYQTKKS